MISVIVPIYNTGKYLRKCLESLQKQTYKDIEILMIDDGSTDESSEICRIFASSDLRFHYFYKKNGGVSSARNLGIKLAKGQYITFVDSDDFIDANMYEEMIKHFSDNVSFVACEVYGHKSNKRTGYYSPEVFLKGLLLGKFSMDVYSKVFRASLFKSNNICFPDGRLMEEGHIWPDLLLSSSTIYYVNKCFYHYILRKGSICNSAPNWNFIYIVETINKYYQILPANFKRIISYINAFKCKNYILLYRNYLKNNAPKDMVIFLQKKFLNCFWTSIFSIHISLKVKLLCLDNLLLMTKKAKHYEN